MMGKKPFHPPRSQQKQPLKSSRFGPRTLGYHSECQIVPVAARVTGLKGIVADSNRRAIGKITERAGNWGSRGAGGLRITVPTENKTEIARDVRLSSSRALVRLAPEARITVEMAENRASVP